MIERTALTGSIICSAVLILKSKEKLFKRFGDYGAILLPGKLYPISASDCGSTYQNKNGFCFADRQLGEPTIAGTGRGIKGRPHQVLQSVLSQGKHDHATVSSRFQEERIRQGLRWVQRNLFLQILVTIKLTKIPRR